MLVKVQNVKKVVLLNADCATEQSTILIFRSNFIGRRVEYHLAIQYRLLQYYDGVYYSALGYYYDYYEYMHAMYCNVVHEVYFGRVKSYCVQVLMTFRYSMNY